MIQQNDISTPALDQASKDALVTAANTVLEGLAEVTVSMTYRKQTNTRARIAGEDYVAMPGVSMEAQTGTLIVHRRVDNPANRRKGVVGEVYFKIKSVTRADGVEAFGYTNVRPEGITGFVVLGMKAITPEPEKQGV
jgi:hypothetical protein